VSNPPSWDADGRCPSSLAAIWIASGAITLIEDLWPLVASVGWPAPRTAVRGVREGWLHCLETEAAEAL